MGAPDATEPFLEYDGFESRQIGGLEFWICGVCSAVVEDREKHEESHSEQLDLDALREALR